MRKALLFFLLFVSGIAHGQVNLTLGLRAYYPFSGNANDVSGNNNNPTFNNATLTADRFGNANSAYSFNGTDNFIQIPNAASINTTNKISLCAWVKVEGFFTGPCHGNSIMMKGDADYLTGNYLLRFDDNMYTNGNNCSTPVVDIDHQNFYGTGTSLSSPGYSPYVLPNQWMSVIYTYDGLTAKLFVNCELKITAVLPGLTFTNAYDLFLGKLNSGAFPYWFNGDMDEVRIYDRAINQDEINVLGGCSLVCDSWLKTASVGESVKVGDLDVSGNQMTIEGTFNCTAFPISGADFQEEIVSKHSTPSDANYILRMNNAYITTTNGFFGTPDNCNIDLNRTYHVALVYNGSSLKFYRNGFLLSQVPASGNLVLNNWITNIGDYAYPNPLGTNFFGYINEVRIWNVARTQSEIQTYMNSSLPNPTTQPGLLAYYTFDNLLNKQGNTAWNGILSGAATINNTNPNCDFVADSCSIIPTTGISNIINDYTPILGLNPCKNELTVEDATHFNIGDTVLVIQMKGAGIDSTNTAAFGTVTDYKNAGNYEFNYVKSKTGNIIELKNLLTRQYNIPDGKVQLVRVPYYNSVTVDATLTCLPWDGSKGGVLVFNVKDTLNLNADINVSGKGFRKGIMHNSLVNAFTCGLNDYFYPINTIFAAGKGESIADVSDAKNAGHGLKASGGGGGMDPNTGGGGGGNGNIGGRGGYGYNLCPNYLTDNNWGLGGNPLVYNTASNKIFMGGAGGAGHCNNGFDDLTLNTDFDGGNGGGLVIISSNYIEGNNKNIIANGDTAYQLVAPGFLAHDGMGGGGAGGTILLNNNTYLSNINVKAIGGKGGDMSSSPAGGLVGPGGGGSGGVVWFKQNSLPANVSVVTTGGNNGVIIQNSNNAFGSTAGLQGINVFNLNITIDNIPFKPNIDSVRIQNSSNGCRDFDFHGLGYTNTNPIASWNWNFGDNSTANTQDASHTYSGAGTFTVTLVVTDINGCKDSITTNVIANTCSNSISNIINDYTPVIALDPCKNEIVVEDASQFNTGDTVLMIQMKGAIIDTTNTVLFGSIIDFKNAGNYEYNYVKNKTGNLIELKNVLTRQYDIPVGKVQLIRVPYYTSVSVDNTLTALPWDGSKGGVLAFNVKDTLTLNAEVDVTGKGFRGGNTYNVGTAVLNCFNDNYFMDSTSLISSRKGEGITTVGSDKLNGRGPLANGGGGGNGHNSGGGGGGGAATGGFGGYQLFECNNSNHDNRGIGGIDLVYSVSANKIFLGGGGGAGHKDGLPTQTLSSAGGDGGGIVIVSSNYLKSNGHSIIANGAHGKQCDTDGFTCLHDGMGGGGGGGIVMADITNYIDTHSEMVNGGKGSDLILFTIPAGHVAPGGGGGGGMVWFKFSAAQPTPSFVNTGGINGTIVLDANNPFGSTPGGLGVHHYNLVLPIDNIPFKPNIDSVRIKDSSTSCLAFDFHGFGYTNTNPIASWNWNFGDNGTANTQNTSHTYGAAGTYTVTLVVTDINGCKDSIIKNVISSALSVNAGADSSFCGGPVSVQLHGTGNGTFSWTPAAYLNNSNIADPIATVSSTTTFYLNITTGTGCSGKDSVRINIDSPPLVSTLNDTAICRGDLLVLTTTNSAPVYHWSPGTSVSDSLIASPVFTGTGTTTLIVTGSTLGLCATSDTILVTVDPLPTVNAGKDTLICSTQATGLTASGASVYTWSPAIFLDDPNSPTPIFSGNTSTTYFLTGTDANGCKGKDTVSVTVNIPGSFVQPPDKSFCSKDTVHLDGHNGNTVQYLWSPATGLSNTTIIDPVANPALTTTYSVLVTDLVCNDDSLFNVVVTVDPLPAVRITKSNDLDCAIKTARLTASGAVQYLWTPTASLSNASVNNPVASPTASTQYVVTGTDNNGCKNKDSVTVFVKGGINGYDIPNSFTPNGDGLNDCFGIKHWGDAQDVYFIIYNRWGEKMFETRNVNVCWDGTYKGAPADAGTYVFYAKALTACGEMIRKGNVLLIR